MTLPCAQPHLAQQFAQLGERQYLCLTEDGLATGLTLLRTWQLWQQHRPHNHSRVHLVVRDPSPPSRQTLQHALAQALQHYPTLAQLSVQLLAQYPVLPSGCHRLIFAGERFSVDLWLGDACAQMPQYTAPQTTMHIPSIAIIGAGIAGLSVAHALASRGYAVTLLDQQAPLAGASGNPRALLAPQPITLTKFANNLMTMGALFSTCYWQQFEHVLQPMPLLFFSAKKQAALWHDVRSYPTDFLQTLSPKQASQYCQTALSLPAIHFKQGALITPHALCQQVLSHPLVTFRQAQTTQLQRANNAQWQLLDAQQRMLQVDQVIVCSASTALLDAHNTQQPTLNAIRGQVSWVALPSKQMPRCALSFGGYAVPIQHEQQPTLLFGASFVKGDLSTQVTMTDHQHNAQLLSACAAELAQHLPAPQHWHGRASTRAQTNDYLPIVGAVPNMPNVWALTALGSKGFSFAPLCAEVLCAQLLGEAMPLSDTLVQAISPHRFVKKIRIKKPYFSGKKPSRPAHNG